MRKLFQLFTLLTLSLVSMISLGYAADFDVHFGVGAEVGHFTPDKKVAQTENAKFIEIIQINGTHTYELKPGSKSGEATGKELGFYLQLGGDVGIDEQHNATLYVDFTTAKQYKKSNTIQLGAGADFAYKFNPDFAVVAGGELHSSAFGFRFEKPGSSSKLKDITIIYSGGGVTLSGGVLVSMLSVKAFTTANRYMLKSFDTGSKEANDVYKKALPKKTRTTTVGLMIGGDF